MTNSDTLLEKLYDLADRQPNERIRSEVARAALLAATHRANILNTSQQAAGKPAKKGDQQ